MHILHTTSDICLTVHHWYKRCRQPTTCNNNGLLIVPISSTCFGRWFRPKHVDLIGIINKPLLLHVVGCLCYLISMMYGQQISKLISKCMWEVRKQSKSKIWKYMTNILVKKRKKRNSVKRKQPNLNSQENSRNNVTR